MRAPAVRVDREGALKFAPRFIELVLSVESACQKKMRPSIVVGQRIFSADKVHSFLRLPRPEIALAQPFYGISISRLKLKRALKALDRLGRLPVLKVCTSKSEIRFDVCGFPLKYPKVDRDRLFDMAGFLRLLSSMQLLLCVLSSTRCSPAHRSSQNECDQNAHFHRPVSRAAQRRGVCCARPNSHINTGPRCFL
ncbi:hypothetical protein SBA2_380011 [Acidobacteriia bacterium SbA2]|nr:hypothetical protein SBA2_380011 [Acidobacteriia bacterium SbA2]